MDRVALLLDGEPWKEKNSALQARDKACITLANTSSNGDVKVRQYLNRVIEIMGQSVINVIFNAKKRVL